jgi:hypothetical protein
LQAPKWHWALISEPVTFTNDDVGFDDCELTLLSATRLTDAKGGLEKGDFHIQFVLPFPAESPSSGKTTPFKLDTSASAVINTPFVLGMKRPNGKLKSALNSYIRTFERRPAVFEVFKTVVGFLGFSSTTTCVAKGAIMLDCVLSECTMQLTIPLCAPDKIPEAAAVVKGDAAVSPAVLGKRLTPAGSKPSPAAGASSGERGSVSVQIRLHSPIRDAAVRMSDRRVLVLDEEVFIPPPVKPSPAAGYPVTPAMARPAAGPVAPAAGAVERSATGPLHQINATVPEDLQAILPKVGVKPASVTRALTIRINEYEHDSPALYVSPSAIQNELERSSEDKMRTDILTMRMNVRVVSVASPRQHCTHAPLYADHPTSLCQRFPQHRGLRAHTEILCSKGSGADQKLICRW